jgi:exodeoxyribonuclease-3
VRLPHLLDWLATEQPDLIGLQELKLVDEKFPRDQIEAAGYDCTFAGQPTYNGVAILTRRQTVASVDDVRINDPRLPDDQKRLIAATVTLKAGNPGPGQLRFVNGYMPNGSEVGSDKYAYKLAWFAALTQRLQDELAQHAHLALVGDFNIAPADLDVHDPAAWHEKILCSTPERQAFQTLLGLGLADSFRHQHPDLEKAFSWWDYRMAGFRRNLGLRIDHILLSAPLLAQCAATGIDKTPRALEQPSDHAPVWADLI